MPATIRRKWPTSIAGIMTLVRLVALGLAEYRKRHSTENQRIQMAKYLFAAYVSESDLPKFDIRFGELSADGQHQQVVFTSRETGSTGVVTVPIKPGPFIPRRERNELPIARASHAWRAVIEPREPTP